MNEIHERLERIEAALKTLLELRTVKDFYSTEEVARLVGRKCETVRAWARNGRVRAEKKLSGRGAYARWTVSHEEYLRYEREGLLPPQR